MPALAFGLKPGKASLNGLKPAQKRKPAFGDDQDDKDNETDAFSNLQKSGVKPARQKPSLASSSASAEPPQKSPKLAQEDISKYNNLSALRSARLQDAAASQIDSSVYDYDGVYDTFSAAALKAKNEDDGSTTAASGPKYMTSLMQSAEVRKRDQLRAKEKLLQKERENEGDEFADKEKFVTGAYKKQQEEMKVLEEQEKKREAEEEERRRKGGGMEAFNRKVLEKEEERARLLEAAAEEAKRRKEEEEQQGGQPATGDMDTEEVLDSEEKTAAKLNEQGAKIVVNDEGEVVDKRQLLGAGLNIAPKKKVDANTDAKKVVDDKPKEWHRSSKAQDARLSQRERQSRMVERQIEELAEKQKQAEEDERKKLAETNKSKVSEEAKMGAKERYLQRKKEREEEAARKKAGG